MVDSALADLLNQSWVNLFQQVFFSNTDTWVETLGTWDDLFKAEGRSNSEMTAAVYAITKKSKIPQYPTEFLAALRAELRQNDESLRQHQETARAADYAKPVRCRTCKDTGWVVGIPHLDTVFGPEWRTPRYTMAVTCHCGLGHHINQKWANAQPDPKQVLGLMDYETKNPHWRAQLQLQQKERDAERAAWVLENGDPFRAVVERLVARYRAQAEAERATADTY